MRPFGLLILLLVFSGRFSFARWQVISPALELKDASALRRLAEVFQDPVNLGLGGLAEDLDLEVDPEKNFTYEVEKVDGQWVSTESGVTFLVQRILVKSFGWATVVDAQEGFRTAYNLECRVQMERWPEGWSINGLDLPLCSKERGETF